MCRCFVNTFRDQVAARARRRGRGMHRGSNNLVIAWEHALELVPSQAAWNQCQMSLMGRGGQVRHGRKFGPRSQRTLKSRFKT